MNKKPIIFISYSREDEEEALGIYQFLLNYRCDPWIDKHHLLPGCDWEVEIEKAIETADYFLACLSKNSVTKRGYVQSELKFALSVLKKIPEEEIFIIPIRLDDCIIPRSLAKKHWLDWNSPNASEKLLASLGVISFENLKIGTKITNDSVPLEPETTSNQIRASKVTSLCFMGDKAFANKDYSNAHHYYSKALEVEPVNERAVQGKIKSLTVWGDAELEDGNYERAHHLYSKALEAANDDELINAKKDFAAKAVKGSNKSRSNTGSVNENLLLIYPHENPPYNSIKMIYVGTEIAKDLEIIIRYSDPEGNQKEILVTQFFPETDPTMWGHHYKYDYLKPDQAAYFHLVKHKSTFTGTATVQVKFTGAHSGSTVEFTREFGLKEY